ncbi:2-succinyl-5-enolpyruvyl-6-hydroxy-3-cyclohexene-1-carboxylic-acid synthase [PVC group bacterium (ex Bugula neritina AB1)]|nr:2-succinyl-5-enolpyruvyl-6-hydroxy-3-cyclohexene-1-carboxylic-acid synthase [PVC group bacterium (ex Bugula neritina AB1)]
MQDNWAKQIIQTLVDHSVRFMVFGSGYRLTPLLLKAMEHKEVELRHHLDERGAAYRALGWAKATGQTAAVLTTSGTALANTLPAVIEASMDAIPLLVISADRPLEEMHCGANQTIDQTHLFGSHVRHFLNLSLNEGYTHGDYLNASVAQAFRLTQEPVAGPVHINCAWREPLEPDLKPSDKTDENFSVKEVVSVSKKISLPKDISDLFFGDQMGFIFVGSGISLQDQKAILKLAETLEWPICPDLLSGLRLRPEHSHILFSYQKLLFEDNNFSPKKLLFFGQRFVSKEVHKWVKAQNVETCVYVSPAPYRYDVHNRVTHHVLAKPHLFCQALASSLKKNKDDSSLKKWKKKNRDLEIAVKKEYDKLSNMGISVVRSLLDFSKKERVLFVGNSLAVRYMDRHAPVVKKHISISSNRGASGIDGIVSTALGFAEGHEKPLTLLIGDLSFLYDLNALQHLKDFEKSFCFVVLNNNGGGIFEQLPIRDKVDQETYEKLYQTPHALTFREFAVSFDIDYAQVQTLESFQEIYEQAQIYEQRILIEVDMT